MAAGWPATDGLAGAAGGAAIGRPGVQGVKLRADAAWSACGGAPPCGATGCPVAERGDEGAPACTAAGVSVVVAAGVPAVESRASGAADAVATEGV